MKKTLLFASVFATTLLAVILLFILPASANTYSGDCGENGDNVTWSFDPETKVLTLSGSGEMSSYYNDKSDVPWDIYRNQIKEVVISDTITRISNHAFQECSNLKKVLLPSALTHLGREAFSGCSALESVVIPNGTLVIDRGAFENCENLTSVFIPNTLLSLNDDAFAYCKNLKTLVIPNSVTSIGHGVLRRCENLTTLSLPIGFERSNATNFDARFFGYLFGTGSAFSNDSVVPHSLKTVIVTKATVLPHYFYECSSIETIVLPNSIMYIDMQMFEKCARLKTVVLPTTFLNTNTSFGAHAFDGCIALTRIEYHGTAEQWAAVPFDGESEIIKNNLVFVSCTHSHWQAIDETHHQSVCTCNALLGEPVAHDWTEYASRPATHLTEGKVVYTCDCGQSKIVKTEKLADHIWNDGVITIEPTVDARGEKTFTCECGAIYTEPVEKLPAPTNESTTNNNGGCTSILSNGIFTMALITLAGGMVVFKKKK